MRVEDGVGLALPFRLEGVADVQMRRGPVGGLQLALVVAQRLQGGRKPFGIPRQLHGRGVGEIRPLPQTMRLTQDWKIGHDTLT